MGLTTQTFDIISRIAIGNGALVYRAVNKTSMRQVALKLLSQDGELDHRLDLDALFADAARLKQITGSHVCQLLDAYADEDGPVLVYEFANGISGGEFPLQKKLDPTQALDVAAQLISALRSGERQRCPHGDLKPSSIIFVDMPEGRPYTFVLDWGLALHRAELRDDSLPYLAPERLAGGPPSHSADLFAAGAVLFYLCTGKVLVAGSTREDLAKAWPGARPEVLAELRPDLPPKFVQWLCTLLVLDPARRPASAVDAGAALATLNPPPPLVPPESIRPRPAPGSRPPVSGIAPAPQASGIHRPAPSAVSAARAVPARPAEAKKKSHTLGALMTIGAVILLVGGVWGGWYVFIRKKDAPAPAVATGSSPSRTPAPSVGAAVPKPFERPQPDAPPAQAAVTPSATRTPAPELPSTPKPAPPQPQKPLAKKKDPIFITTEPFAYAAGAQIEGLAEGSGWAAPWKGPPAAIEASSLSYPGHAVSGGSLMLPAGEQEVIWSRPIGPLSEMLRDTTKGGHYYFAALVQHTDDSPAQGGDLRISATDVRDPHAPFQIVITDYGSSLRIALNDPKTFLEVPDNSKPVLIVCRIAFSNPKLGNWDVKATLMVNPNFAAKNYGSAGKSIDASEKYFQMPKEYGVLIRKKRGQAVTRIDEIRYGRHWEEMVFQPPQKDSNE